MRMILLALIILPLFSSAEFVNIDSITITKYDSQCTLRYSKLNVIKVICEECFSISKLDSNSYIFTTTDKVQVIVHIESGSRIIKVPFNVSCQAENAFNTDFIKLEKYEIKTNKITVKIASEASHTEKYFVMYSDEKNTLNGQIVSTDKFISVNKLQEKTQYQICVIGINNEGLSNSAYKCGIYRTDFSETGPVTNLAVKPYYPDKYPDTISVIWSKPTYAYDKPGGYLVTYHVRGSDSANCKGIVIKMNDGNVPLPQENTCKIVRNEQWQSLQELRINNLNYYTYYEVTVSPINGNRISKKMTVSIQTAEGESGPVQSLYVSKYYDNVNVAFHKPTNPNGVIKFYRVEMERSEFDICENSKTPDKDYKDINYVADVTFPYKPCSNYKITVRAVNGFGFGKKAEFSFKTTNDKVTLDSTSSKYISSNLIQVDLKIALSQNSCPVSVAFIKNADLQSQNQCNSILLYRNNKPLCKKLNDTWSQYACSDSKVEKKYKFSESGQFVYMGEESSTIKPLNIIVVTTDGKSITSKTNPSTSRNMKCYTDCRTASYTGIRSAGKYGEKCNKWINHPKYKVKSNYCTMQDANYVWCYVSSGWQYCNIPKCGSITKMTGCVSNIQTSTTSSSITGSWSSPKETFGSNIIGYLIILHDSEGVCTQYTIQTKGRYELTNTVKNFYISCEKGNNQKNIKYTFQFDELQQNTLYSVYILPVIDETNVGSVMNVTVSTKLAKPRTVTGVKLNGEEEQNTLKFTWTASMKDKYYGDASSYELIMTIPNGESIWRKTSLTSYSFDKLRECTEYCLRVSAENKAGKADLSEKVCAVTKSPALGEVTVHKIEYGYGHSKDISWRYMGSDNCPKRYGVQYRLQRSETYKTVWTSETNVIVSKLTPNTMYVLQIIVFGLVHSVDNRNMSASQFRKMYTGNEKVTISNFVQKPSEDRRKLEIKFSLKRNDRRAVYGYSILIKNQLKKCIQHVNLKIKGYENHKPTNLNQTQLRKNCFKTYNRTIDFDIIIQHHSTFEKKLGNYSIEVFALTALGYQIIMSRLSTYKEPGLGAGYIVMIIISILIILLIICLTAWCVKRSKKKIRRPQQRENRTLSDGRNSSVYMEENTTAFIDNAPELEAKIKVHFVNITKFEHYMKSITDEDLKLDYKRLNAKAKQMAGELGLTTKAGSSTINAKKNRFINILPYDQTQILLANKEFPENYINANRIPFINNQSRTEYIASQGPIDDSIDGFWQMIWQENVSCIVMLTRVSEDGNFKCLQYWPTENNETIEFGEKNEFIIKLLYELQNEAFIERMLELTNSTEEATRRIVQIQMHTWCDYMAPNLNYFDRLLLRFHEIVTDETATYPYLIHCSAGVGRTGTFITLDRIVRQLVDGLQEINIFNTILELRRYRASLVQRQAQYIFIHEYIDHFLKKYLTSEQIYFNEDD